MEKIIIQVGSQADLKSTIDQLEKVGAVDEKNAKAFKAHSKETQSAIDTTSSKLGSFQAALTSIGPAMAGALSVGAVISLGKEILDVTAKFQKFEAVLTNTLGSNSEAQKSIKMITKLAAETPFGVDELVGSYVKLVNQGFKPTEKEIIKLGDLAASQGKSFDMLTEAIIDAQTGEFERLKEFGIRASKEGDKVSFTFKGVKTQTDFTSESIRKYILGLGELKGVSGGMVAISKTLGGQISNLADAYDSLLLTVGTKLQGAFAAGIGAISQGITTLKDLISGTAQESSIFSGVMDIVTFSINKLLAPLKEFFNILSETFTTVFKPIGNFLSAIFVPIIESFQKAFGGAGSSVSEFIAKFNPLMLSLRLALIPLQLLAAGLELLTPIITEYIVPAFQSFTIFLAKARNEVADFVNAIIQSGFAKRITSTFGFEIAKIGKVNIDELRKSFEKNNTVAKDASDKLQEVTDKIKVQITSIDTLKEKVKQLTDERDKTSISDTKKINSLNQEIHKTEELIKRLQGQDEATKKARKELDEYNKAMARSAAIAKELSDTHVDPLTNVEKTKEDSKKIHKIRVDAMKKFQKEVLEPQIAASKQANKEESEEEAKKIKAREDLGKQAVSASIDLLQQGLTAASDLRLANEVAEIDRERAANEEKTNKELASLEKRKELGLLTETAYNSQKERILKKAAKVESELKKKQFEAEKQASLRRVAIDTAVSIAKTFATYGFTPPAIIAAAAAAASGLIQAAVIKKQPTPEFFEGGYTGEGNPRDRAGIVHKREYVMPHKQTANYREELEAMRKGTYEKYRMPITRRQSLSEARHEGMTQSLYNSIMQQKDFDDQRIVGAIKDSKRPDKADSKLAVMIASKVGDRIAENRIME